VRRTSRAADAAAFVVLLAVGAAIAVQFLRVRNPRSEFFDWELVPAVMMACGHGFAQPAEAIPELAAFVARTVPSFDCARIAPGTAMAGALHIAQASRYAVYGAATALTLAGVTWRVLDGYLALLFGISTALSFAVMRLVAGRALAVLGALMLAYSVRLEGLLLYRDYIKEPPFLALLLVVAWLATRPQTPGRIWPASALAGVLLGVGIGCRMDLLVFAPFVLATLALVVCVDGGGWALRTRGVAAALFAVAFAVTAAPILRSMSGGSNSAHVVLLGFMSPFTTHLGLVTPAYDVGDTYSDGYAYTMIASQARLRDHLREPMPFGERVYDEAGGRLVSDVLRHFPADMLARAFGAVRESLAYPFSSDAVVKSRELPAFAGNRLLSGLSRVRAASVGMGEGWGFWLTVAALLVVAAADLRLALFGAALIAYFCGYSMLQYSRRHTFHLDLFAVAAVVLLAQVAVSTVTAAARRRLAMPSLAAVRSGAGRVAAFAAIVAAAVALPLAISRAYQQRHVAAIIEAALQEATPLPIMRADADDEHFVLLSNPRLGEPPGEAPVDDQRDVRMEYIVATFGGGGCGEGGLAVQLKYTGVVHTLDKEFDRTFSIPAGVGREAQRVLAPVFFEFGPYWTRFDGLMLPSDRQQCLLSLARVPHPGGLPFPFLYARLHPSWRDDALYQRFDWRESGRP
jgi:hypothetical protein